MKRFYLIHELKTNIQTVGTKPILGKSVATHLLRCTISTPDSDITFGYNEGDIFLFNDGLKYRIEKIKQI